MSTTEFDGWNFFNCQMNKDIQLKGENLNLHEIYKSLLFDYITGIKFYININFYFKANI